MVSGLQQAAAATPTKAASWDEEGVFVYQVVHSSAVVRSHPTVAEEDVTRLEFDVDELVSVDLIEHNTFDLSNGPYVRLTDRTGWLFVRAGGTEQLRRLHVHRGLWSLYVDNYPHGQFMRRHPVESQDLVVLNRAGEAVLYPPMQQIYCDARVCHPTTGVYYYRVQGTTGWVFDRRLCPTTAVSEIHKRVLKLDDVGDSSEYEDDTSIEDDSVVDDDDDDDDSQRSPLVLTVKSAPSQELVDVVAMLIPEHKVQTGLFCFRALYTMVIRKIPSTSEECMTRVVIKRGQLVSVNVIRASHLNDDEEDGPFVRLTDGSGWLFVHKGGVRVMEKVPIKHGYWEVKALNEPVGVGLRRLPIDCQDKLYPFIYPTNTLLQCNAKIVAPDGVCYYRVCGTSGWVFDKREESRLLLELSAQETPMAQKLARKDGAWTPDFVRGIAATMDGLLELPAVCEDAKVLTFQVIRASESRGCTINVFCESLTVGVCDDGLRQTCERDCTVKDLARILRTHTATPSNGEEMVVGKKESNLHHGRVEHGQDDGGDSETKQDTSDESGGKPESLDSLESDKDDDRDPATDYEADRNEGEALDVRVTTSEPNIISSPSHYENDLISPEDDSGDDSPDDEKFLRHRERRRRGQRSSSCPVMEEHEVIITEDKDLAKRVSFHASQSNDEHEVVLTGREDALNELPLPPVIKERSSEEGLDLVIIESRQSNQSSKDATCKTGMPVPLSTDDLEEMELRAQLMRCEETLLNFKQEQIDILRSLRVYEDARKEDAEAMKREMEARLEEAAHWERLGKDEDSQTDYERGLSSSSGSARSSRVRHIRGSRKASHRKPRSPKEILMDLKK